MAPVEHFHKVWTSKTLGKGAESIRTSAHGRDLFRVSDANPRARGNRIALLIALLAVVPGLVSAKVYLSQTNPTLTGSTANVGGATCTWDTLNTTDMASGGGTGQSYVVVTGEGTSTATLTLNVTKSALYQYMIDEVGLVCTTTNTATHFDVNLSTSAPATGSGVSIAYVTLQSPAVNTAPFAGAVGAKGDWVPSGATPSFGNNPADNPTTTPGAEVNKCDYAAPGVYAPYDGYTKAASGAQPMANTYSWSLNASAWTVDGCTTGHTAPPDWSYYYGATPFTAALIYTLSIELVTVGATGFSNAPSITFTAIPLET